MVGLELGADDYVTKPFSPRELALRVRAILRRTRADGEPAKRDPARRPRARPRAAPLQGRASARSKLTAKEFELLRGPDGAARVG